MYIFLPNWNVVAANPLNPDPRWYIKTTNPKAPLTLQFVVVVELCYVDRPTIPIILQLMAAVGLCYVDIETHNPS